MKVVLVALNAKFIHSSLALRSIRAYYRKNSSFIEDSNCPEIDLSELTINNSTSYIISEIFQKKPDVICFSCYIWNIDIVLSVSKILKKVLPDALFVYGGPEVSYENEFMFNFGQDNNNTNIIIVGEGEKTFTLLIDRIAKNYCSANDSKNGLLTGIEEIRGLKFRNDKCDIVSTGLQNPLSLDDIPPVYYDSNNVSINSLDELENKIIYYESSRGCPFSCRYCMSSIEKGVRFLSMTRVKQDLMFFISNKVRQVKFVDRTFNCDIKRAMEIWNFLIENDNGVTNFHFEISADLITDDALECVKNARPNLFQFEIGIQSVNQKTLHEIKRNNDFHKIHHVVETIQSFRNIHLHLDLIVGLPDEDYESFKTSFNYVYSLAPEQLQIGFLKLLRGSGLREDSDVHGIVYSEDAPYEVLFTKCLTYDDLLKLKRVEEIFELYYNSNKFVHTLRFLVPCFETPFDFFEIFTDFWYVKEQHKILHNKTELFSILFDFCQNCTDDRVKNNFKLILDSLKFDLYLSDNVRSIPTWLSEFTKDLTPESRKFFSDKSAVEKYLPLLKDFSSNQLYRMCCIVSFDFDLQTGIAVKSYYLFDYHSAKHDENSNLKMAVSLARYVNVTEYFCV